MITNVMTPQGIRRKRLLLISLMLVVLLVLISGFILAIDVTDVVHVSSETELVNTVNNASKPTVIMLDNDITLLDNPLVISADKDIMLMSDSDWKFFKLIGANDTPNQPTISVSSGGILRLEGITVTHIKGVSGTGMCVNLNGTLIMSCGKIAGNIAYLEDYGGGVLNHGSFVMSGGEISGNTAKYGGGVANSGVFEMIDGTISNNLGNRYGGGVYNNGNFSMLNGAIKGNNASSRDAGKYGGGDGGGVANNGTFSMFGGEIFNNFAHFGWGGSVYNQGNFSMFGGKIFNNTDYEGTNYGGVVNRGVFNKIGGEILDNIYSDGVDVGVICVGVVVLVVGVVGLVFFLFPKKAASRQTKSLSINISNPKLSNNIKQASTFFYLTPNRLYKNYVICYKKNLIKVPQYVCIKLSWLSRNDSAN
jgi:flagellar basal body-associated protein FliL